jgi:hypothetical protein
VSTFVTAPKQWNVIGDVNQADFGFRESEEGLSVMSKLRESVGLITGINSENTAVHRL